MSKPLLITDCDEVLLHMVSHFKTWLHEVHDCEFAIERAFAEPLTRNGVALARDDIWELLDGLFSGPRCTGRRWSPARVPRSSIWERRRTSSC